MKQNILIIGKNSFLAKSLFKYFKNKNFSVLKVCFKKFYNLEENNLSKFDYIINCSIKKSFIKKNYQLKYDQDYLTAKKLANIKSKLIILSSSKVYGPGYNLKENSKKKPINNYGINKLLSEKNISKFKKELLIFRLSNIVGKENKNKSRKITNLFFDDIRKNLKKKIIIIPKKNYYKDFVLIDDFVKIIYLSILKNLNGIFNLSTNYKTYLHDLAKDISNVSGAKIIYKNIKTYSFTLNNKKLINKLNINKLKNLKNNFYKYL